MLRQLSVLAVFGLNLVPAGWGQTVPLYRVTVVERTVKAVNYQYRSGPTAIDFRGTVLLPESKGDAIVESKAGRTAVDAHFSRLPAPQRFGGEYLTYVLWAITPEGHPKNLGEIIPGSSDKAHTDVTTDLQAFGLIVTAEPYAAVREPSDVVVMENEVRPDTIGGVQPVQVKYELMPRHGYTYNKPSDMKAQGGPMVSMGQYETMLEVYQAQNAVQIAQSSGAAQYAPEVLSKAQNQLQDAQTLQARRADKNLIITAARNAEQTAEDARILAEQRAKSAEVANAQGAVEKERQLRLAAEAQAAQAQQQAEQAKVQAQQAQAQATADRTQLEAAQQAQVAPPQPPAAGQISPSTLPPPPPPLASDDRAQRELRRELGTRLNECLPSRDTPRGLVATVSGNDFQGSSLDPQAQRGVTQIAALLAAHPGLTVEVEGNSDANSPDAERLAFVRAEAVRDALVRAGAPAGSVNARSMGMSRPIGPNNTAAGRAANKRVEIVVSGAPIGGTAVWDRSYPLGRN